MFDCESGVLLFNMGLYRFGGASLGFSSSFHGFSVDIELLLCARVRYFRGFAGMDNMCKVVIVWKVCWGALQCLFSFTLQGLLAVICWFQLPGQGCLRVGCTVWCLVC